MMSGDSAVTVTAVSGGDAAPEIGAICHLYDEVFSVAPFVWPDGESARHRQMMGRIVDDPTFGAALARARGDLVGFVYGVALTPLTRWWEGFQEPVGEQFLAEWPGRTFAVIDLAVHRDRRGRGVGRRLLGTLLAARPEERATLAVQPDAVDSHAFYKALGGWHLIGRQDTPGSVSSQFDIYVSDLVNR
ncbi:ribosomal protein S18 acetylase RimI-like enzyme [Nocardia transvalensis]|uniref:Ribosomal protein S18 acetylase RimI-like enzyme n=1 Tax=Nocardia transvalensis TaxID=37333 RepID=A0A7W9UH85_9NOCA|nr:GNAT family N-acetyltransferase [Nocardia transvalensis]MBB5912916.1 ribosomal protein S18 acetylase RimI-like enzyme [Nocardia transvalensis]